MACDCQNSFAAKPEEVVLGWLQTSGADSNKILRLVSANLNRQSCPHDYDTHVHFLAAYSQVPASDEGVEEARANLDVLPDSYFFWWMRSCWLGCFLLMWPNA